MDPPRSGGAPQLPWLAEERDVAATGTIDRFLQTARRRHWTCLALEYLAVACCMGAAGVILLLVLGSQLFNWYWPLLLFLAAAGAGLVQARRRQLTTYGLAQVVDAKLGLEDRISSFVFFREIAPASLTIVERQALERLHVEDVKRAVPIAMPRYGWVSAALVLAAIGLLGVRYGVLKSLDLSAPIARIEFGAFQPPSNVQAATKKSAIQERFEEQLRQLGLSVDELNNANQDAMAPEETSVTATADGSGDSKEPGRREGSTPQSEEDGASEGGEQSQGDGSDSAGDAGSDKAQEGKPQGPPPNAKQNPPGSKDGLIEKMKDAFANLLNKLKMQPPPGEQSASNNPSSSPSGKQQSEQGMQSRSKSTGEGQPGPDQQGQEGEGEKMSADQSRAGERNADRPGSQESKTGMGRQDGAKDIKEAEQLAAMGKLSEIIGKRAQQVTGEITVEVSSGKQTLKTAYTDRKAMHADSGANVERDEIPLAYQSYIQRYFEEVRKTAPPAKVRN